MNAQGVLAEATGKFKARLGAMLREKNDAVMEKNDVQDALVLRGEEVDALVVERDAAVAEKRAAEEKIALLEARLRGAEEKAADLEASMGGVAAQLRERTEYAASVETRLAAQCSQLEAECSELRPRVSVLERARAELEEECARKSDSLGLAQQHAMRAIRERNDWRDVAQAKAAELPSARSAMASEMEEAQKRYERDKRSWSNDLRESQAQEERARDAMQWLLLNSAKSP